LASGQPLPHSITGCFDLKLRRVPSTSASTNGWARILSTRPTHAIGAPKPTDPTMRWCPSNSQTRVRSGMRPRPKPSQ